MKEMLRSQYKQGVRLGATPPRMVKILLVPTNPRMNLDHIVLREIGAEIAA